MTAASYDVLSLGNAIVDVIAHADDDFLDDHELVKGTMALIDEERATTLYAAMGPGIEVSGGSGGNTAAGVASCGGRVAFAGKVRDDQLGAVFRHDMRAVGVTYDTSDATSGPATARSLILVTPDAQRTMNTFLGASTGLSPSDIDPELSAAAEITYIEGFLLDAPLSRDAVFHALDLAKSAGRLTSVTLSDVFCVQRHHDDFLAMVRGGMDIVFGNESEFLELYGVETLDDAVAIARTESGMSVITLGAEGSMVVVGEQTVVVAAEPVAKVVDTTGAGDMFAAGFLYGFTRGKSLEICSKMGNIASAEVITHVGARPEAALYRRLVHAR